MDTGLALAIVGVALAVAAAFVPIFLILQDRHKSEIQRLMDIVAAERSDRSKVVQELEKDSEALGKLTTAVEQMTWRMDMVLQQRSRS